MADHAHTETLALRMQFDTEEQQKDCSTLGMWIFLITEVMFFGGMFAAYTIYRQLYFDVFAKASTSLNATIGAFNTCVLLFSSFTMVMAVRAGQLGKRRTVSLGQAGNGDHLSEISGPTNPRAVRRISRR